MTFLKIEKFISIHINLKPFKSMKKLFLFLVAFGVFFAANAQFGIRAGLSSGNFSDTNFNAKVGYHVGGYYRLGTGFISVEPGVQFSTKGYEGNVKTTGAVISEKLNYVDIPVLVRLNVYEFLNVFAGPQASLLLSRKYELDGNTDTSTEVISGYDIGGVVGLGVSILSGINFQISYDLGLKSLNYYNTDVKNRVLKLSVGIDI
jgi:hypothetical protein